MVSEVIEELQASEDALERELGAALLKWQDEKADQGLPRSMGYEPRDIRSKGAVAVIEARVLQGSSGFGQIDQNSSYEAIVDRHPERFRDDVVKAARHRLLGNQSSSAQITSEDVRLISSSRDKSKFADLSENELAAYTRVTEALEALGNVQKSSLPNPDDFEVRLTSGFSIKGGIRGYIPKDLWFSVSPKQNAEELASIPQLFMIVSERGIEYGYLPIMKTDITLRSGERTIVADAKYYREALAGGRYSSKVRSAHLYQLSTYLTHTREREPRQKVSGLLIYPAVGQNLRLRYQLIGTPVLVATVDLSAEWPTIHEELVELIAPRLNELTNN